MNDREFLAAILQALPGGTEAFRRVKSAMFRMALRHRRGRALDDAQEELRISLREAVKVAARGLGLTVLDGESWKEGD